MIAKVVCYLAWLLFGYEFVLLLGVPTRSVAIDAAAGLLVAMIATTRLLHLHPHLEN